MEGVGAGADNVFTRFPSFDEDEVAREGQEVGQEEERKQSRIVVRIKAMIALTMTTLSGWK